MNKAVFTLLLALIGSACGSGIATENSNVRTSNLPVNSASATNVNANVGNGWTKIEPTNGLNANTGVVRPQGNSNSGNANSIPTAKPKATSTPGIPDPETLKRQIERSMQNSNSAAANANGKPPSYTPSKRKQPGPMGSKVN